jgi:hypothetical protein
MEVNDAQSANAILDLHYLRSSESGLLALCLHLRAIQHRTAVLRANHAADSDTIDPAELLGFRSLTILCGRGANASPQGYSLLRLVVMEALVRVGLAPIARATVSMTIGADRSVASVVDAVTIESADLWRWCAAHADRRVALEWLRPTL